MQAFGVTVRRDGSTVGFEPGESMRAFQLDVPADPSSAAFFVALAMLSHGGALALPNVCLNPTRTGFFDLARRMGASIEIADAHEAGCEPIGTLVCRGGNLRGITVAEQEIPSCIDELPLLAVLAARAEGETVVTGAHELRVKESDRIRAVVSNLMALGAQAEELPDGFRIVGSDAPLRGTVQTHGDHRIAMAFGILAALPENDITIDDRDCVAVSYPGFWDSLESVSK
jgi:3-phosphoshikimate 1-carboxyvinyltransferase